MKVYVVQKEFPQFETIWVKYVIGTDEFPIKKTMPFPWEGYIPEKRETNPITYYWDPQEQTWDREPYPIEKTLARKIAKEQGGKRILYRRYTTDKGDYHEFI